MSVDTKIKEWATPKQCEYIDAVNRYGTSRRASKVIGISRQVIEHGIKAAHKKAAKQGYAPQASMYRPTVAPFVVKGTSTLYDKNGNMTAQWVKTKLDPAQVDEAMREAIEAMMQDVPRSEPVKDPLSTQDDLCNLYTITDYHVGMRSWAPETGEDWDLDIAERVLVDAFRQSVKLSPNASTCIVNQLGDFLHFDSLSPITPASGHLLDADSRYSKVVRTATRLLRIVIDTALQHHKLVIVVMAEGNHDTASSVWLRHLFSLLYEREPRVQVIDSESPFYAYHFGKTMLGFHHGHLVKNAELPLIFAARYPEIWGNTIKRYVHVGHWHHVEEKEHAGMKVVQHATLAAADSYAARHGYLSSREITTITYHRKFGQVARNTVCPEMLIS